MMAKRLALHFSFCLLLAGCISPALAPPASTRIMPLSRADVWDNVAGWLEANHAEITRQDEPHGLIDATMGWLRPLEQTGCLDEDAMAGIGGAMVAIRIIPIGIEVSDVAVSARFKAAPHTSHGGNNCSPGRQLEAEILNAAAGMDPETRLPDITD